MRNLLTAAACGLICVSASADDSSVDDAARLDFFEKKIRPVLVEHCYQCHSADSRSLKAGLRLDTADGLRTGGDSGPAVLPGKPGDGQLLSALRYESFEMPPDSQLPDKVVANFEKWIADGAVDPRTGTSAPAADSEIDMAAGRNFWAFQVPELSPWLAQSGHAELQDSDRIDALVNRRLQEHGLRGNGPADRRTLLRRLSFALTGLPPTPEEMEAFVTSDSPQAWSEAVDRLLDSPAYGERWTRMWLDVARYAEDQAHIVGSNKALFYPNAWKYRDWVIGALNEDMPYDRFLQLQLAADLIAPEDMDARAALGFIGLGPKYYRRNDPEVMAEEWEDRVDVVTRGLQGLTVACARCHDHKYDPIATEDYYALAGVFASSEMYNLPLPDQSKKKDTSDQKQTAKKKAEQDPSDALHVIRDKKPQDLAVMIRGKVDNKGDVVPRGFLQVLFDGPRREFHNGSGRAELAAAVTDSANPLTARVIVNRVWKEHFGRGLVATTSNFGQLGERPSHPELLDDLSVRFMQHGWSLKWLHRQIVMSAAWQRSSDLTAAAAADPEDKWLWRMPRRRLSVEAWRDAVLSVAGTLNREVGGESIRPDDPKQTRRTVYAEISRFELNPLLARFDFPDPNVHAATRVETNTPLQKLFLLNNPFMITHAKNLAARVTAAEDERPAQIRRLFQLVFQRLPDDDEMTTITNYLTSEQHDLAQVAQTLLASNEFWYVD
ncbi:MAG: PSD1 and planctomycete cytochrome C domain-containing protein [Fuerstiella sp.]